MFAVNFQSYEDGGNVTVSFIKFTPKPSNHHSSLICRGTNDEMTSASAKYVEDHHRMEIFCKYKHLIINSTRLKSALRARPRCARMESQ